MFSIFCISGERDAPRHGGGGSYQADQFCCCLKKLVPKVLCTNSMKNLFKSKKRRTPCEIVRDTRRLLLYVHSQSETASPKYSNMLAQLDADMKELKSILYGVEDSEPVAEACTQLTQEFFNDNAMSLLILCLPKINFEARKDATRIIVNLQGQTVHSRLIACQYLEENLDLLDTMITGYEDPTFALHYGGMLRECIRHQVVASYVLKSAHIMKFFYYIQLPNFDVASDAAAAFKLLGYILLEKSNSQVMARYVSSKDNIGVLMNLLRERHKCIQINAFHVFKLFVANQNKPIDINILCANRNKLVCFFDGFNTDKEDEMFEKDKADIVKEIMELVPTSPAECSGELSKSSAV